MDINRCTHPTDGGICGAWPSDSAAHIGVDRNDTCRHVFEYDYVVFAEYYAERVCRSGFCENSATGCTCDAICGAVLPCDTHRVRHVAPESKVSVSVETALVARHAQCDKTQCFVADVTSTARFRDDVEDCRRSLAMRPLIAALAERDAEIADAMVVLSPSMPESGLVDACRQVRQAALSWRGNAEKQEVLIAEMRRLI